MDGEEWGGGWGRVGGVDGGGGDEKVWRGFGKRVEKG